MQLAVTRQTAELIYNRRLSILPSLTVGFARHNVMFPPHVVPCLELRNIGNGSAINIAVADILVRYEEKWFARIRFEKFAFLEPNKENSSTQKFAPLRIYIESDSAEPSDPAEFASWIISEDYVPDPVPFLARYSKEKKTTLAVRFQDVDGNRYCQSVVMKIDRDKLQLLELGCPVIQELQMTDNSLLTPERSK